MARRRGPRSDSLVDGVDWKDDGCDRFPACLACPLERCRYDGGLVLEKERHRRARLEQIHSLRAKGLSNEQVAEELGISKRTVFRALAKERES